MRSRRCDFLRKCYVLDVCVSENRRAFIHLRARCYDFLSNSDGSIANHYSCGRHASANRYSCGRHASSWLPKLLSSLDFCWPGCPLGCPPLTRYPPATRRSLAARPLPASSSPSVHSPPAAHLQNPILVAMFGCSITGTGVSHTCTIPERRMWDPPSILLVSFGCSFGTFGCPFGTPRVSSGGHFCTFWESSGIPE